MAKMNTFIKKPPQKEELSEAPQVEELLKNLEFHNAIQTLSNRILEAETPAEIIVSIKEDIRNLFNIHSLTIYLIDKPNKEIFTMETQGNEIRQIRFPLDFNTFAGYVAQKKKLLYIADAYNERDLRKVHERLSFDPTLDRKTGVLTGQIIATPIMFEGIVLGVMEIMNKKGGTKIEDYHQIYLDEIAGVLAKAFDNHLNFQQLAQKVKSKFDYLLKKGFISEAQVEKALRESRHQGQPIESLLLEKYGVGKEDLGQALAEHYHCRFVAYDPAYPIPSDLLIGLDYSTLETLRFVPIEIADGKIRIIVDDPSDMMRRKKIEGLLETGAITFDVAFASDINDFIHLFFEGDGNSRKKISESLFENLPAHDEDVSPLLVESPEVTMLAENQEDSEESSVQQETGHGAFSSDRDPEPYTAEDEPIETTLPPDDESPVQDNASIQTSKETERVTAPFITVDASAAQLAGRLIQDAFGRRATDLHFEPDAQTHNVNLRIRVDGQCVASQTLSTSDYEAVIGQLKMMANLSDTSKPAVHSARLRMMRPSGDEIQMRIVIVPTAGGREDAVVHFSSRLAAMRLENIGMTESPYLSLTKVLEHPRGMVLITGPTGSGVTTTLHACLNRINSPGKIIWTLEQPLEILQPGLRQVSVDSVKGLAFSSALRTILSADPDIIGVGDLPDSDTALLGSQAALDGRLFLGAMSTVSFVETIEKLTDMGLTRLLLSDVLLAVVSERLIRTLCPRCKEKYTPGREEYDDLALRYGREAFEKLEIPYDEDFALWRPVGCDECNQTGYGGRTGIFEILTLSGPIKRMIRQNESIEAVYDAALANGTKTLIQDWIEKILEGRTDATRLRQILIP